MPKLHFLWLLSLLQVLNVLSGGPDEEEAAENAPQSFLDVLPLTLIQTSTIHVAPTQISNIGWVNDGKNLSGSCQFSNPAHPGQQNFLCGADPYPSSNKPIIDLISSITGSEFDIKYCNFPITFKESDSLKCAQEPNYTIEKIFRETPTGKEEIPCQRNTEARLYRFVYHICTPENPIQNGEPIDVASVMKTLKNRDTFEVFQFCYDSQKKIILHTRHNIVSSKLLDENALKNERNIIYPASLDAGNYFHRDLSSFKESQESNKKNIQDIEATAQTSNTGLHKPSFVFQKLVPSEDFPFATWRKPTFDLLNRRLMRQDLIHLWDHISELIRKEAIKKNREYQIQTAAFRRIQETNALNAQIPEIWIKTIYYYDNQSLKPDGIPKYKAIAIVMNQFFDEETTTDVFGGTCKNLCAGCFDEDFPDVGRSVSCCSLHGYITDLKEKVDATLELDFLHRSNV